MAIVKMTKCDNPQCTNVDRPESERPYRPPYGWVYAKGGFMGCGPFFNVVVCSVECFEPALNQVLEEDR